MVIGCGGLVGWGHQGVLGEAWKAGWPPELGAVVSFCRSLDIWFLGGGLGRRAESLVDGEVGRGCTGWIASSQASLPQDRQGPLCSPVCLA